MPKNHVVLSTEKSILGVLMESPYYRGEVLKKYPGRFEGFFFAPQAVQLLRALMSISGQAYSAAMDPLVPDLLNTEWSPQAILDQTTFEATERFWLDVEQLRRLAKGRRLKKTLVTRARDLDKAENVDTFASETGAELSAIVAESSLAHDPSMAAVQAKYEQAKAERKLGVKIPTLIPRLDEKLLGGLRIDPGELVVISGREKQRKTTLLANIVSAWHRQKLEGATAWICNEQSVDSVGLLGMLWALEASRLACERDLTYKNPQDLDQTKTHLWTFSAEDVLGISGKEFRDQRLLDTIAEAYEIVGQWNIRFYCAGLDDGNAMNAEDVCARVRTDIEYNDVKRVVVDNFQGWTQSGESDYEVMTRAVPLVDVFTGTYHCLTIALSQKSRKDDIKGGGGLEGRAQLVLDTSYDEQLTPGYMKIKRTYGRNRPWFELDLQIDPRSGLIVAGQPYAAKL